MAKALKIVAVVAAVAALTIVTGGAAAGLGVSLATTAFGVSAGALLAVSAIASAGASLLSPKPKMPTTSAANADRLNVSVDLRTGRKIIFGRTAMATDLRDQEWSADQVYLHRFVICASHRVHSIQEIWFDDKLAWTSAAGVQGSFIGYLSVTPVLEGSAANAINIGPRMGASRRYTGCAYVYFRYRLTGLDKKATSPFASSVPTRVTIVGEGASFYDPRLDSTVPGGSGAMRADDQATWSWNTDACRNPALAMLFYLLGWRIRNPVTGAMKLAVGKGLPADRIDLASFITAANLCDEPVARSAGGTEPRYRCDGIFAETDDTGLVLDNLKATMNAVLDDVDGKIRVTVLHNDLAAPIGELVTSDVLGDYVWVQTPALNDTFNSIRGGYTDPSSVSLYQLVDAPEVRLDSPDGIDRSQTLNLPTVQSPSQWQRLAKQRLERGQFGGTFTAVFQATAWKYQKGDVIRFSFYPLGFNTKLFRIADIATQVDGAVPMMLREEHPNIYMWDASDVAPVLGAAPTSYDPTLWPIIQGIVDIDAEVALIASDGVLSHGSEKSKLIVDYLALYNNFEALDARYAALGSPGDITAARNDAYAKRQVLDALLLSYQPGWSDVTTDTVIDGTQLRVTWASAAQAISTFAAAITGRKGDKGEDGFTNVLHVEDWIVGTTDGAGRFSPNGDTGENSIVLEAGPTGASEPVWKMVTGPGPKGAGDGPDGGWNYATGAGEYDSTRSYRFMVWAKQEPGASGTIYFGTQSDKGGALQLDGVANGNPYFWSGGLPEPGRWFLIVGILHGSDYEGADSSISGVYDPLTGQRVQAGGDFKAIPGSAVTVHRAYQFYSLTGSTARFARPWLEEVTNGTYSVQQLFATVGMTASQAQAFAQAQARITAISSDGVLSAGSEKSQAIQDWQANGDDFDALEARYQALGTPWDIADARNQALAARGALNSYLNSLAPYWANIEADTPIVASVWRQMWGNALAAVATFRAAITGRKGEPGQSALTAYLTNENVTLVADVDGNPISYSGASGQFEVFLGSTDVTSQCVFGVAAASYNGGAFLAPIQSDGSYACTALLPPLDSAWVTYSASYQGTTVRKTFTIGKARIGANGESPPIVVLNASSHAARFDGAGALISGAITFTSARQNTNGATIWEVRDLAGVNAGWGPAFAGAFVDSSTGANAGWFTSADGDTLTMSTAAVEAFMYGRQGFAMRAYVSGAPQASDIVSIFRVQDGARGENAPLLRVQWSIDGVSGWHDNFFGADVYQRQSNDNGVTWGQALRVIGESASDGIDGITPAFAFRRSATVPAAPADNTGNPPTGWSDGPPAGADFIWQTSAKFRNSAQLTSWTAPQRISGADGLPGEDSIVASLSANTFPVSADYNNTTKSGQLPRYSTLTVKKGAADITATAAVTVTTSDPSIAASYASGQIIMTAAGVNGSIDVAVLIDGVSVGAPLRIQVSRTADSPPPASPTTQSGSVGYITLDTTYNGPLYGIATLRANASGQLKFSGYIAYYAEQPPSGARTARYAGCAAYRASGSGGYSYAAEVLGSISQATATNDPSQGVLNVSQTISGLTPNAFYDVGFAVRKYSGSTQGPSFEGNWTVSQ